jgi:hypothetical protein
MEFFKSFIGIMAYASLGFTVAAAYLKINKIWKRKHNAEVADSVSVVGNVVYLIPLSFFALNYIFIAHWQGLIDSVIWIASGIVYILIGSRLWVQSHRHKTFWTRLQEVLKLERSEVGDLAKSFFRPSGGEIILNILAHFAYIDRKLTVREKEFIQSFADTWHMKFDWNEHSRLAVDDQPVIFIKTREKVEHYLDTSPPVKQVSQLIDVLHVLSKIDESVSAQEELILEEVDGLLLSYLNASDAQARFAVVIAPQNDGQDSAIATLLPDVKKSEVAGGSGYMIGSYYSHDYADMICNQYRALGFFTIEIIHDSPEIA